MCRIAGIFDPNNQHLQEDILKMRDAMHRGGPDDAGLFTEGNLALGHRRLSIIDLSAAGHQPMHSENQNLVMVYNGELYNFKEIRSSLEALGHTFHTQTDSEVVLKAFEQWGNACFQQFNGMFAIAIYNKAKQEITLARDHAGIKPLYYFLEGNQLYFASEIRAFKALNRFQENPDWKIYFLAFGHLPEPITTLQDVKQLPKGTVLKLNISGIQDYETLRHETLRHETLRQESTKSNVDLNESNRRTIAQSHNRTVGKSQNLDSGFWTLDSFTNFQFTNKITNSEQALAKVKDTLSAAVERHLISDAPIGLFLSGGIDSSLLTILAEPILKDKLQTLSIVFDETEFSEKKYQDIIIAQTGTKHRTYTVSKAQFLAALPDVMEAMDQPSNDGINTYFICKYAKEAGLTAVLSGLGADELFGGYNSFANAAKVQQIRKWVPSFAFKAAQWFSKDKYQKAAFLAIPGPIGHYLFNRGLLCPKEIARNLNIPESKVWTLLTNLNEHYKYFDNATVRHETVRPGNSENKSQSHTVAQSQSLDSRFSSLNSFNKASFLESNLYMQNQLLKDSDYMSMWHSIEIRVPFLDKELMQLAYQISPAIKAHNKQKKFLLIHALGNQLPRAIWDRPKMGFTFPFQKWLGEEARDEKREASENLASRRQSLDNTIFDRHDGLQDDVLVSENLESRRQSLDNTIFDRHDGRHIDVMVSENLESRRQSLDNTIFDRHDGHHIDVMVSSSRDVMVSSAEPHSPSAENTLRQAQGPKTQNRKPKTSNQPSKTQNLKPKTSSYAATQFSKGNYNWSRYWVTQIVEGF